MSNSPDVLDLDELPVWGPWVEDIVAGVADQALIGELFRSTPEYIEDARDWVVERTGRELVQGAIARGLHGRSVRLYHGTRLADADLARVREEGLRPLDLIERRDALIRAFSRHPRWSDVEPGLTDALIRFGPKGQGGRREDGCVHVCFSRAGLLRGCNHYLTHGAEVDGHIAHHLFGDDSGHGRLRDHRRPYLIAFDVPFDVAAQGCHSGRDLVVGRELLADKLLGLWAYGKANPTFRVDTQRDCTAATVPGGVGPDQLTIEPVDEAQLAAA